MNRQSGFSLIELAIVVVIVTILTLIAVPIYKGVQEKARRTQAVNALQTLATREEGYFDRYNTYTPNMASLGYAASSSVLTADGGYYAISATSSTATTYTLTAKPQGRQSNDKCGNFVLNSMGQKSVNGTESVDNCWH